MLRIDIRWLGGSSSIGRQSTRINRDLLCSLLFSNVPHTNLLQGSADKIATNNILLAEKANGWYEQILRWRAHTRTKRPHSFSRWFLGRGRTTDSWFTRGLCGRHGPGLGSRAGLTSSYSLRVLCIYIIDNIYIYNICFGRVRLYSSEVEVSRSRSWKLGLQDGWRFKVEVFRTRVLLRHVKLVRWEKAQQHALQLCVREQESR